MGPEESKIILYKRGKKWAEAIQYKREREQCKRVGEIKMPRAKNTGLFL